MEKSAYGSGDKANHSIVRRRARAVGAPGRVPPRCSPQPPQVPQARRHARPVGLRREVVLDEAVFHARLGAGGQAVEGAATARVGVRRKGWWQRRC